MQRCHQARNEFWHHVVLKTSTPEGEQSDYFSTKEDIVNKQTNKNPVSFTSVVFDSDRSVLSRGKQYVEWGNMTYKLGNALSLVEELAQNSHDLSTLCHAVFLSETPQ